MIETMLRHLAPLAAPLGFVWLLLLVATGVFLKRRRWRGAVFFGVLVVGMSVIGGRFSLWLVEGLEKPYMGKKFDSIPEGDAVMMMGGVLEYSRNDPMGFNLTSSADRVVVALELMRRNKARALILGGGGSPGKDEPDESQALNGWLTAWKMPAAPVHLLGVCANTHDEASKVAELAKKEGWKKIIVVTSASHMRRTMAVFRTLGVEVVPVACDFNKLGTPYEGGFNPIPSPDGFHHMDIYLHEKIGWMVYRMRGWISSSGASAPDEPMGAKPVEEKK